MLHGCTIGAKSLVGIQAVVVNGAVICRHSIVGAGSIVTEGKVFEDGWLLLGAPAKPVRRITEREIANIRANAKGYVDRQATYRASLVRS